MKPKRIEFWSSTEYSGFLEGLMRELPAHGLETRQRFQILEVSYRGVKSPLERLFLRVRQYLVYPLQLICTLLFERFFRRQSDVCVVSTNTFYAPLLATFLHPNVVHLIYDLFPEAMIHSGKWKDGSLKVKCVCWITRKTLWRARMNVFLGQRLKEHVESQYGALLNATVIEVGADQTLFGRNGNAEKLKTGVEILYCGNLGNLHDTETIFSFWKKLTVSLEQKLLNFRWRFNCSGPKQAELVAVQKLLPSELKNRIQIGGGLSQSEWIAAMKTADIALVTMMPGSESVVMPSKAYSAMMAGQSILAIAPEESDLVDMIKAVDCGWWIEPGNVDALEKVLIDICANTDEILKKGVRAYIYAHECLGQDVLAEKWRKLLDGF